MSNKLKQDLSIGQNLKGKYSVRISVLIALKQIYGIHSFDAFFEGLRLPAKPA